MTVHTVNKLYNCCLLIGHPFHYNGTKRNNVNKNVVRKKKKQRRKISNEKFTISFQIRKNDGKSTKCFCSIGII